VAVQLSQNAFVWTQIVPVRGSVVSLGYSPTVPDGHILLHQQRGLDRRHPSRRGVPEYLKAAQRHGERVPTECPQLLDSCTALPGHALHLRPAVLDEQQDHIQCVRETAASQVHRWLQCERKTVPSQVKT